MFILPPAAIGGRDGRGVGERGRGIKGIKGIKEKERLEKRERKWEVGRIRELSGVEDPVDSSIGLDRDDPLHRFGRCIAPVSRWRSLG